MKKLLNRQIKADLIRIVGEFAAGVYDFKTAIEIAENEELDLIQMSFDEKTNTAICKVMDYKKFLYETEKKNKNNKCKNETKEIQLSYNIAENDVNTKLKQAIKFLKQGDKVKLTLMLKGRENCYKSNAELVIYDFLDKVSDAGIPEYMPKFEGNKYMTIIKKK